MLLSKPTSSGMRRPSITILVMALIAIAPMSMNIPLSISPEIPETTSLIGKKAGITAKEFLQKFPMSLMRILDQKYRQGLLSALKFQFGEWVTIGCTMAT